MLKGVQVKRSCVVKQKSENVHVLLQKPKEVSPRVEQSPYLPTRQEFDKFVLPDRMKVRNLRKSADTILLSDLGVTIPRSADPVRFEEGFRWGLAHNARQDAKKMTRSHNHGFCFAKCIYRKFSPGCRLAASGAMRFKITAVE